MALRALARHFHPRGTIVRESGDLCHGELRIYDPECNPISLSERHFGLPAASAATLPRIPGCESLPADHRQAART